MRCTFALLTVVALAGGLVACGDDAPGGSASNPPVGDDPSATPVVTLVTTVPATSVVAPTAPGATDQELAAMLLTADDIGAGWAANTDLDPADLGTLGESPCPDVGINPTITQRLQATTGVLFEPVDGSLRGIQELLVRSDDPGRLALDLDAVFGAVEQCMGLETTAPDGELVTMVRLELPAVGDSRLGATVTVLEPPDFRTTWLGHLAVVRVGNLAIMLNQFDIVDSPDVTPPTTDAEFIAMIERSVQLLEQ